MSKQFDAARARLSVASQLFKTHEKCQSLSKEFQDFINAGFEGIRLTREYLGIVEHHPTDEFLRQAAHNLPIVIDKLLAGYKWKSSAEKERSFKAAGDLTKYIKGRFALAQLKGYVATKYDASSPIDQLARHVAAETFLTKERAELYQEAKQLCEKGQRLLFSLKRVKNPDSNLLAYRNGLEQLLEEVSYQARRMFELGTSHFTRKDDSITMQKLYARTAQEYTASLKERYLTLKDEMSRVELIVSAMAGENLPDESQTGNCRQEHIIEI